MRPLLAAAAMGSESRWQSGTFSCVRSAAYTRGRCFDLVSAGASEVKLSIIIRGAESMGLFRRTLLSEASSHGEKHLPTAVQRVTEPQSVHPLRALLSQLRAQSRLSQAAGLVLDLVLDVDERGGEHAVECPVVDLALGGSQPGRTPAGEMTITRPRGWHRHQRHPLQIL